MATIHADIVIVGAGLAGASTAYHLRRLGKKHLIILEKEQTAGLHSSGRNAGLIREKMEIPELQELATQGASFLRKGQLARFCPTGLVLLGEGDEPANRYFPLAKGAGRWFAQDGRIDVLELLNSYLVDQVVHFGRVVEHWAVDQQQVIISTSNHDTYICQLLINAAGPWGGVVGKLPLTPCQRHIFITTPMPEIAADWPFVWDQEHGLYFRPEEGGLLISPCDEQASIPGDYTIQDEQKKIILERFAQYQPGLGKLEILRGWVGQRTFSPDRKFVIGFDSRTPQLFHVAGLGGHGITTSYAVGKLAAELILGIATDRSQLFSPSRFF